MISRPLDRKRLKALEAKAAQEGLILTEEQLKRLREKKKRKKPEEKLRLSTPVNFLCKTPTYVGTIKGVGRIYQQTVIDTYTKVAFAKLYNRKNSLLAADMLNSRVIPWMKDSYR